MSALVVIGIVVASLVVVTISVASATRCKKCRHWCQDETECSLRRWLDGREE